MANTGSLNIFKDDINGNTFTRAHNLNGLSFAFMDGAQSLFTNLNSADMTKGVDLYNGTLGFYRICDRRSCTQLSLPAGQRNELCRQRKLRAAGEPRVYRDADRAHAIQFRQFD
jgi:hypothetical protein